MSSSLVLGLGNRLSGADGFGPAVLEALRGSADLPASVCLIDAHTDLLAYLDRFAEFDRVILVDTVISTTGNRVTVYDEDTFSGWDDSSPGAHELSPLAAVKLFRQLRTSAGERSRPVITLVAHVIGAEDFSQPPTETDIAAGGAAVRRVLGEN
jgi:hydrogenase maturation protease